MIYIPRGLRSIPEDPRKYANLVREAVGISKGEPCELQKICDAYRIRVRSVRFDINKARTPALLFPRNDGFTLVLHSSIDEGSMEGRRIIGHEIGHAMFYENIGGVIKRYTKIAQEEEVFCDKFSTFLLSI